MDVERASHQWVVPLGSEKQRGGRCAVGKMKESGVSMPYGIDVVGWRNPVMSRLVCLDACRELWGSTPGDGCEEDMPE